MNYLARTLIGLTLTILAGCGSQSSNVQTSVGKFAPAQNDRYAVTSAELGAIILDGQHYLRWGFALRIKQPVQLRSVRVEDVTSGAPVSYISDQAPQVTGGQWAGYSGVIEPNPAAIPWLYDNTASSRIFRITLTDLNNQVSVLNQTVSYSPQSKKDLRKWYSLDSQ